MGEYMKTLNRVILILIFTCCMLLVACDKPVEPDEMAQILYQFYIQEDMTDIDKLGLTQEEATKLIDSGIEGFEKELQESLWGIACDYKIAIGVNEIENTINARRELEKKLTAQTQIISKEKDKAQVELKTTYFDEQVIYEAAGNTLEERVSEEEFEDEDAFMQRYINIYIEEIIAAYESAEISTEEKSIVIEFTKQDGMWLPVDSQAFIDQLTELTSGYEVE